MYGKTVTAGSLALTPGITYSQTGSIIAAGVAMLFVGAIVVLASRFRRKHDDNVIGK